MESKVKTLLLAGTALTAVIVASGAALAATTGVTGGGQPFGNLQPSLAVTEVLPLSGIFPRRDSGDLTSVV